MWMTFVGFFFFLHALLYLRDVSDKFSELKEDITFKDKQLVSLQKISSGAFLFSVK